MKVNVELEIGWMSEDDNIDEVIQSRIVNGVVKQLSESIDQNMKESLLKRINNILDEKVNVLFEEFMNKTFDVCDNWGDIKQRNVNVKEILKTKLDNFLTEKVDPNGKVTTYQGEPRYMHLINEQSKKQIAQFIDGISKAVIAGIKDDINTQAQNKIVNAILSDYKLKDLIK